MQSTDLSSAASSITEQGSRNWYPNRANAIIVGWNWMASATSQRCGHETS